MKTGMLWLDDDKTRSLAEKVERAAAYYQQKHGAAPNACRVHPSMLDGVAEQQVNGVAVTALPTVLPHHFLVGVDAARPVPGEESA